MCAADHGHIVTVASTAAFVSPPGMSEYCASKAGVLAFHEVLSAELFARMNAKNVKTTVICPVKVRTALGTMVADHNNKLLLPVQEAWQVAERIVLAVRAFTAARWLDSDSARFGSARLWSLRRNRLCSLLSLGFPPRPPFVPLLVQLARRKVPGFVWLLDRRVEKRGDHGRIQSLGG